jgi:hypothetical protein
MVDSYVSSYYQVIAKMFEEHWGIQVTSIKGFSEVRFTRVDEVGIAEADTLGLAVVVAALHALKVPELEKHGED